MNSDIVQQAKRELRERREKESEKKKLTKLLAVYLAMCDTSTLLVYDVCLQLHYQNDQAQVVLGERANGTVVLPQGCSDAL